MGENLSKRESGTKWVGFSGPPSRQCQSGMGASMEEMSCRVKYSWGGA